MKRCTDWIDRLAETVDMHRRDASQWGQSDCAMFVADCVQAMTGEDLAGQYRGAYDTERGSKKALAKMKCKSVADLPALHFDPVDPVYAQRGDIAVIETDAGPSLGVFVGERIAVRMTDGVGFVDRSRAVKAFTVP